MDFKGEREIIFAHSLFGSNTGSLHCDVKSAGFEVLWCSAGWIQHNLGQMCIHFIMDMLYFLLDEKICYRSLKKKRHCHYSIAC